MSDVLSDAFTALANASRRRLFDLLVQQARSREALIQATGLSGSAVTRHLTVLMRTGLVQTKDSTGMQVLQHEPKRVEELRAELRTYVDGLSPKASAKVRLPDDSVDINARAWALLWPAYPADAYAIGQRLLRLASHVEKALKQAAASVDLLSADLLLLDTLILAGRPWTMTPTQLQRVLLLTKGGVTKTISRLEARGLVQRKPDPADGRGVRVTLTPSARVLLRDMVANFAFGTDFVASMQMSADRRAQLAALLRELLALANAEGSRRGETATLNL